VGLAARPDRGGRLSLRGIESISPREGARALSRILLGSPAHTAVLKVDWDEWSRAEPSFAETPFLEKLAGEKAPGSRAAAESSGTRAEILAADPGRRPALAEEFLRRSVADVLRLPSARIDLERPLLDMGIDSLMAVELKNRTERELGVKIPLLSLIKGPSVSDLARSLLSQMTGEELQLPEREAAPAEQKSLLLSLLSLQDKREG
jgi:acyl carrier protein